MRFSECFTGGRKLEKKGFARFAATGLVVLVLYLCCFNSITLANSEEEQEQAPILQIPVMSDTHICGPERVVAGNRLCKNSGNNDRNFEKVLKDYQELAPNYKAMAIVGDLTDHGLADQYDTFMETLHKEAYPDAEKLLVIGNHEFFSQRFLRQQDQYSINLFLEKTMMPALYYDKWVEGFHFITLGSEGTKGQTEYGYAEISDVQYAWLEEKLAEDASADKPIFVFLHQPINDTVYGSEIYHGDFGDGKLKAILQKYPQAILFTGHSHYNLSHPRTFYQDGFTMVNTGSVNYSWFDGGRINSIYQGLLVNVYEDKVVIKAREFSNNTWINEMVIPLPKTEDAPIPTKYPVFPPTASIHVKNATDNRALLEWTQAVDATVVDKYLIKVNGNIAATYYPSYWEKGSEPSYLLKNLTAGIEYNLEIIAVNAYNKTSVNSLIGKVTLKPKAGWVLTEGKWYYIDSVTYQPKTGWLLDKGKWYYLSGTGEMLTGWQKVSGAWYYLNPDGDMKTGWLLDKGKWYYLKADGAMQTGWLQERGKWYYLLTDGSMQTGWVRDKNTWFHLNSKGEMSVGWLWDKGKWYYLNTNGSMKTGWLLDKGKWYLLDKNGVWVK